MTMKEPRFYTRAGTLTAYALGCGYVERRYGRTGGTVDLYREHGVYHVRLFDRETGRRVWVSSYTLAEARKTFRRLGTHRTPPAPPVSN